ncbi:hypothetical protein GGTG_04985 [Gaeumannomyces tritici R3-111a-1]|uniref:Uncharacterized protein n=1 Tax=Gaeumannomyces tritici (strain R3-111a-1) TaxID=644352 RepID=J3NUM9_GAET3|nr:hypothetical protein GGTG_04985 [Gaeumannomyces tritici R3-111a-1]EJT79903.1 hypothetical protein GGTG_04985 [Gaeumannomyces tritici R3-111a-1]
MDSYDGPSRRDHGSRHRKDHKTRSSSSRKGTDTDMKDAADQLESLSILAGGGIKAGKKACKDRAFAEAIKLYGYALKAYERQLEMSLELKHQKWIIQEKERDIANAAALLKEAEVGYRNHLGDREDLDMNYRNCHHNAVECREHALKCEEEEPSEDGRSFAATEAWRSTRNAYMEAKGALEKLKAFDAGFAQMQYPGLLRQLHDEIVDAFVKELQRRDEYLWKALFLNTRNQFPAPEVFKAYDLTEKTLGELERFDPQCFTRDPSGRLQKLRDHINYPKEAVAEMKVRWAMVIHVTNAHRAIAQDDRHQAVTELLLASVELENARKLPYRRHWTGHGTFGDALIAWLEKLGAAKFGPGWYPGGQHPGPRHPGQQYPGQHPGR